MVPVDGYLLARYGIFDTSRVEESSSMFIQPLEELSAEERLDLHDFACLLYGIHPIGFGHLTEPAPRMEDAVIEGYQPTAFLQPTGRSNGMAQKVVFKVVACLGDEVGTIEVDDTGDEVEIANAADRAFREQYGEYRRCDQCGDSALSLHDSRDFDGDDEPYDPDADEGLIDEA